MTVAEKKPMLEKLSEASERIEREWPLWMERVREQAHAAEEFVREDDLGNASRPSELRCRDERQRAVAAERETVTVVVTGGRHYADRAKVFRALDTLRPTRVAQGGASGADALAREWCEARGVECHTHEADWGRFGRAAGPRRNRTMLLAECPDAVVVFPGGDGTRNCTQQARDLGYLVLYAR